MLAFVVLLAGVLLDALLVQPVDDRGVVLLNVVLFDVVMLVPVAMLTVVLLDMLLDDATTTPTGVALVSQRPPPHCRVSGSAPTSPPSASPATEPPGASS